MFLWGILILRLTYIKILFYCIQNVYLYRALIVFHSAVAVIKCSYRKIKTILNPTVKWTTKRVILNWKCFVKLCLWLRFMGPWLGTNSHTTTGPYQVTNVGCSCSDFRYIYHKFRDTSTAEDEAWKLSMQIAKNYCASEWCDYYATAAVASWGQRRRPWMQWAQWVSPNNLTALLPRYNDPPYQCLGLPSSKQHWPRDMCWTVELSAICFIWEHCPTIHTGIYSKCCKLRLHSSTFVVQMKIW
jgi:hypothetical protein